MKMNLKRSSFGFIVTCAMVTFYLTQVAKSQEANDYSSEALPIVTSLLYKRLSNLTTVISSDLGNRFKFCVKDSEADWNKAFNFSSNLNFLSDCILSQGNVQRRLCTSAEVKLYFNSFSQASISKTYFNPNRNCNLTSWVTGCEPGWACSVDPDANLDLQTRTIPIRTQDCKPCCAGFFCPHGLTCMIPCPLGSYCPQATLNKKTGVCQPYRYQLPAGQVNHTCGGADIWADVGTSSEIFCPAGSFCPSTAQISNCSSGQYCRMGSTSPRSCFKLTSCNANSAAQNMRAYGFLAALGTLLLILYNCSDQVLTTRERRLAKTREAAARSARETANARQRWKAAKNLAKKHFSRTLSRTKQENREDELAVLNQPSSNTNEETTKKRPADLMRMIHEIENDPDGYSGIDVEVAHPNVRESPVGNQRETDSQIFRYAYNQLEKEKAMQQENKNLTFSKVIAMATDPTTSRRPLIEIVFKDLTLTLKAKNKDLLRCVTGKIKPGRITAVMGPSGAGKTTFLSALAGKTVGCRTRGLILVNGISASIHSYRRIVGFVPQDDIVHGNLTVEENLWFSARCRLPAKMPKPDKVLIVERVIESLGLQAVRDSLVGTVEKRGISGGQRKRVNVGIEMVMEPSLLILDEPTSGLDSASSQQLLRALRREALEGVNVCMVVHQPSYALFKMFDDLLLLAKGGLAVYLGPVTKVEEYFSEMGITVPGRVNPPDHYIDILEGIVPSSSISGISHKELPVRWMIHKGYTVPQDLQKYAAHLVPVPASIDMDIQHQQSFAGELWQDVRNHVEVHKDKIRLNFLNSIDLSKRQTPGTLRQYKYILQRVVKQRLREAKTQAVDYLILLLAGACLGSLTKSSDQSFGAAGYTYTIIAVSLLCKISALRSFTQDKLQHWRESASGISSLAYFLSKDSVDLFNIAVKPLVYLSMFYFLINPRSIFAVNYAILVCLVYCVTGLAYALAIFFEPGPAQLWSVLLPVVLTLIATKTNDSDTLKFIANFCYPRWALEAFVITNAERYYGVWLITRCGSLIRSGYNLHNFWLCLVILIAFGVASRLAAFLGMLIFQKK